MAKVLEVRTEEGIEGCTVVEDMGYNHSVGMYAKSVVRIDGSRAVAVAPVRKGPWRFWGAKDRLSGGRMSKVVGQ